MRTLCHLFHSNLATQNNKFKRKMDGGGSNSGGFHSYQKLLQIASDHNYYSPTDTKAPDISMGPADDASECIVREQDRFMPIANVIRIMRKTLPPHAKISDDAKETIQECVSEFISFVTSEANVRCQREQRKTITAEDVLWAMSKLGFDDYIEPLTMYLHLYREFDGGERGSLRGEPLPMKRTMPADHYHHAFQPPALHHMAHLHHPHGFFGGPPMNFIKDTESSQAHVELFPQCKEQKF